MDQITDYDKLTIDVWCNGSISFKEASSSATINLSARLLLFMGLKERLNTIDTMVEKEAESKGEIFDMMIEELNLPNRVYNCLKRNGVSNIEELIRNTEEEMLSMRKFGRRALKEVNYELKGLGLSFRPKEV